MSLGEKSTLTISRYASTVVYLSASTNHFTATTVTVPVASPVPFPAVPLSSSVSTCQFLVSGPHRLT
jgi:hypothetical protein